MGHLSLNALSGTNVDEAIRVRAMVKNQVMLTLLDSESSHSFVSSSFLQRVGNQPTTFPPVMVKVANGDILISDKVVQGLQWWVPNHTFTTDVRVLYWCL